MADSSATCVQFCNGEQSRVIKSKGIKVIKEVIIHVVYLPVTVDSIYAMSIEKNVVSVCIVDAELDCKDVSGHGSNKDKKAKMKKEYYR